MDLVEESSPVDSWQAQQLQWHHRLEVSEPDRPPQKRTSRRTSRSTYPVRMHRMYGYKCKHARDSRYPDGGSTSHSHPSSRATVLAFLLILGIALTYAMASGYESMRDSKIKRAFGEKTDDYAPVNEKPSRHERSVIENAEPNSPDGGATATILSRASQLSSLISHLDASDVVEVYVVTRMAHLTNVASNFGGRENSGGGGNRKARGILDEGSTSSSEANAGENAPASSTTSSANIPSGPVMIRKSALAFRYRPRVASASHSSRSSTASSSQRDDHEHRKYFELTLEYGPERVGATRSFEAMPVVHMDTELMAEAGYGKYATWSNDGRVYYSIQISNEWTDAYYMAPITGVVLEKIIQHAADYNYKRPRYQPFEVVSIPSGNLVLRSSGADDFVSDMFRDLAELYVEIDPLLVPPRSRVQFYVSDPEETGGENGGVVSDVADSKTKRSQMNSNVVMVKGTVEASRAATFYEKFFNCANAIKTGDYSMYDPPPTHAPTTAPSIAPSKAESNMKNINETARGGDNSTKYGVSKHGAQNSSSYYSGKDASEKSSEISESAESNITNGGGDDIVGNSTVIEEKGHAPLDDREDEFNMTGIHQHRNLWSSLVDFLYSRWQLAEIPDNSTDEVSLEITSGALDEDDDDIPIPEFSLTSGGVLMNSTVDAEGFAARRQLAEIPDNSTDEVSLEITSGALDEHDDDIPIPEFSLTSGGVLMNSTVDAEGFADDQTEAEKPEEPIEKDPADAAIEAAKAADNAVAVVASNTTSAADTAAATSEAAKAAQKAKDASVAARSKASAEALLSGDGVLMTSILSSCFSDLKYGIRTQEEINHDAAHEDRNDQIEDGSDGESGQGIERQDLIIAYIYVDGDVFFRLNLTAPYWGVTRSLETVPPPHMPPEGRGDAVDWTIFLLILAGTLFGLLVMLHQANIVIDKRLRFRSFFHPTKSDLDDIYVLDWEKLKVAGIGGGFPHTDLFFTMEAIPISMGGESQSPAREKDGLDLEMAQLRSPHQHVNGSARPDPDHKSPMRSPLNHDELPSSLRMKRDTPDLVERPTSRTFTKVSFPKQSPVRESPLLTFDSPPPDPPNLLTPPPRLPKSPPTLKTHPSGPSISSIS